VLLLCVACETLLGLEHGSALSDRCPCPDGGSRAVGGEGGEGASPELATGGSAAGLDAGANAGGKRDEGVETTPEAGAGGNAGRTGNRPGGSSGAGTGGTGGGVLASGGAAGQDECTPGCELDDAAHCSVACTEGACVTRALDADGDDHGDELCLTAPGDDCDDARFAVKPGAPELCDGFDNDCSGTLDLEDGLPLSGTNESLWEDNGLRPVLAYSEEARRFGIAWREAIGDPVTGLVVQERLHYRFTDSSGGTTAQGSMEFGRVWDVAIATASGEFALLWATPSGAFFQRMLPDGTPIGDTVEVTRSETWFVALAHTTQGGWTAFWHDGLEVQVREVGVSGELGPVLPVEDVDTAPIQVVVSGQSVLFLGQSAFRDVARIIPTSLVGGSIIDLGKPERQTYQGQIAARPDGFGTASVDRGTIVFKSFEQNGLTRCGPVTLPEDLYFFTIAPSSSGYVVFGGQTLVELSADCAVVQQTSRPENEIPGEPEAVSGGDAGFLVTWSIYTAADTPTSLGIRRFGPHFCD
jgi:hypothetical protein